jgi:CelD/BcsL family acetyltransferase involved in cellulose biosynthesis
VPAEREQQALMRPMRVDFDKDPSQVWWSLAITRDLCALAAEWQRLEERASITPYQRYDYLAAWSRHAALTDGIEPCIGAVRDENDDLVMLLPLGVTHGRPRKAAYLGGTHTNLNMPLVVPAFLDTMPRGGLRAILNDYCRKARVDSLVLRHQPSSWRGRAHPFLTLPHLPASEVVKRLIFHQGPASPLDRILSVKARARLRRKEKRFAEVGARFVQATTDQEIDGLLAFFLEQKARRLAALGERNAFLAAGAADFVREAAKAARRSVDGFRLSALLIGDHPIAIRGTLRHGGHLSFVLQSFDTEHPMAKLSPGDVLLARVVEAAVAGGVTEFDFGLGETGYKQTWSNESVHMFDSVLPMTALGHAHVAALEARQTMVQVVKQHRPLYSMLKRARARLSP